MSEVIKVGMAELKVATAPNSLMTLGLGSCVGVAIYDPVAQIGGLVHVMLPDSTQIKHNSNKAKFADTGIKELVEQLIEAGANKRKMVAKIAGGAQMFQFKQMDSALYIGMRNTEAVKENLKQYNIPLLASDTGNHYGRTVEFCLQTGRMKVKSIGNGIKEI